MVGKLFSYDNQVEHDLQVHERQEFDNVIIQDISYRSEHGERDPVERVSAYLVSPRRTGGSAGVLFMHPAGVARHAFLKEAIILAGNGAVSLLIDAPYARPPGRPVFSYTSQDRDDLVQNVVDLRRGIDLLLRRLKIDAQRIGFVGFSYGATVGAMMAGVEKRIKACVLWGGGAQLTYFLRKHNRALNDVDLGKYLELMSPLDALHHVSLAAPTQLFFQNGLQDKNVPVEQAQAQFEAASEPRQIGWYKAGHSLNSKGHRERYEWLQARLGLDDLSPGQRTVLGKTTLKTMAKTEFPLLN